jgi:N6-L-threonylcarbamoyladenine synthase
MKSGAILALESSCDETAVAVFDPEQGLLGEWVHTQIALHQKHGGVVPDLATREHLRNFTPLLERAKHEIGFGNVSEVAVTSGPGLAACLAVGVAAAKALAMGLEVSVWGVNHLRAHAFSPFISVHQANPREFDETLSNLLPHLGLIVSGGNTILCEIDRDRKIRLISTTRDDAAGEALDKGAKLLGLGYPGGPLVEKQAQEGNPEAFDFPRGLGRRDNLDFSFSGLKTSLRYRIEKMSETEVLKAMPDLCASYQQAVIDALIRKMRQACEQDDFASLGLSGGVANNEALRSAVGGLARRRKLPLYLAQPKHTGDNAGMIAFAAWIDRSGVDRGSGLALEINPNAAVSD